MKKSAMSLLAVAGCAFGLSCSAMAQWTPSGSPFAGPYTVTGTGGFFQSIDLNGASAPVGNYGKATVTADWLGLPGSTSSLWQSDSKMSLVNAAVNGVAAVPGGVTIHYGGTAGTAPTTATGTNTPGTIRYDNVNLSPLYVGGNPLFMAFRTSFTSGGNFSWSNINVTLTPPPPPPANETCATALDITAAAGAAMTGPGTNFITTGVDMTASTQTTAISAPVFSCNATVTRPLWYRMTPPATGAYRVRTCTALAAGNNMANNILGVFEITNLGDPCNPASYTQVACGAGTTGAASCTGGIVGDIVNLDSTKSYYIVVGRTGTTALGTAENTFRVAISRLEAGPTNVDCANAEDISAGANAALTTTNTSFAAGAKNITGTLGTAAAPSPFSCQATVSRVMWYKYTPAATGTYIAGTCTLTGQATQNTMANNVVAAFDGSAGCGSLTSLACSTTTCTGGVQTAALTLNAGTNYYFAVGRTGSTILGVAELNSQLFISRPETATCGVNTETEPNDTRATASSFTLNVGDTICGTSTGTSTSGGGLATYDFFKIKTPAHAGIKRNRIRVASLVAGHTLSLRGYGQTTGVINTTESEIQASSTSSNPLRMIQWYTLGNGTDANDRAIYIRVGGTTSTTAQYSLNYIASDDVTPIDLSRNIRPGSVTITSIGQNGASDVDTDLWMYDSNFNPISGFGNDDTFNSTSVGSTVTRTMTDGTYYMAITRYNLANNQGSPADDDFRTGVMFENSGLLARGTSFTTFTPPASVNVKITDTEGDVTQAISLTEGYQIAFVKVVVAAPVTPGGCNPADIACDDGTPLAAAPGCTNSTTGPNEGDYNAFFAADGFFFQAGQGPAGVGGTCDIACDDGTPLSQAPGCTNNGVNEGDYNCFFNNLFLSCI
ncbi:MAG: hypothetical protein IBJ18_07740 [Phycisphaerales bacterium]|nr:hypothetical protein [Phycisphaerales bacterium]